MFVSRLKVPGISACGPRNNYYVMWVFYRRDLRRPLVTNEKDDVGVSDVIFVYLIQVNASTGTCNLRMLRSCFI